MDYVYLTKEALTEITEELKYLKGKGRAEAAKAIAEARAQGDLSENAEYDAAKEAQGLLEKKIAEVEDTVARARVIDKSKLDSSKVCLLANVELKNVKTNKSMTYQIVSEQEADIKKKKISSKSPIGEGVMGKTVGEIADITTPNGVIQFEIVNISL